MGNAKSLAYNLGFEAGFAGEFADFNDAFDAALKRVPELRAAFDADEDAVTDDFFYGFETGVLEEEGEREDGADTSWNEDEAEGKE